MPGSYRGGVGGGLGGEDQQSSTVFWMTVFSTLVSLLTHSLTSQRHDFTHEDSRRFAHAHAHTHIADVLRITIKRERHPRTQPSEWFQRNVTKF